MLIHERIICDMTRLLQLVRFLSHSWIQPCSLQMLYCFLLLKTTWQDFKLKFILKSTPENRNYVGSVLVDNVCQGRPRLKYGSVFGFLLFFLVPWRSHFLWRIATQKRKKRKRGSELTEKHSFVFLNDIECDTPDKTSHIFHQKSQTLKKKDIQAAHINSQQKTLLLRNHLGMHAISLSICALLSVYIESVSDELFYIRFKIFKNKISLYVKKDVWGKKTDLSMLILSIWV